MNIKISILVPVYKVEAYLPRCIESVLSQDFTDYELILVDDGSPDKSGKICEEYASRYPEVIKVIHKRMGTSIRQVSRFPTSFRKIYHVP